MQKINLFILALVALMPNFIKCAYYRHVRGAKIHPSVRIGLSILNAKNIRLSEGVRISHLNIINNLHDFHLGKNVRIRNCNIFNALPKGSSLHDFPNNPDRNPSFYARAESTISSYHYFNCDDSISIGAFSAIAGRRVQLFTHAINYEINQHCTAPIVIGNYCRILTQTIITYGLTFPDYSTLGANSVLTKSFSEPYTLYAGVPAKPIKRYDENALFFSRTSGII